MGGDGPGRVRHMPNDIHTNHVPYVMKTLQIAHVPVGAARGFFATATDVSGTQHKCGMRLE